MLNTQPYGGGLWHTWFDRDCGIAGRVLVRDGTGKITSRPVWIDKPIARIPNLAIHLTSGKERDGFEPNLHEHGKALLSCNPAVLATTKNASTTGSDHRFHPYFLKIVAQAALVSPEDIVDMVTMSLTKMYSNK
jgi:aspartyl aminopeptidase